MFGNKNVMGKINFEPQQGPVIFRPPEVKAAVFVEFQGATGSLDDDGRMIEYVPRDKITINVARISGYYDHTILVDGRKIRVMETYSQIALKILEAMK